MKYSILLFLISLLLITVSCKNSKKIIENQPAEDQTEEETVEVEIVETDPEHNSQNSLDWPGRYVGVLPCADCEGIEVSLAIQEDGAYFRSIKYLGKPIEPQMERGKFQWNTTGNYIRLQLPNSLVQWYEVGENTLYHLDANGKRIEGDLAEMYVLKKEYADHSLEGKRWILKELNGESIEGMKTLRSPFISFDGVRKRVGGNDGCNSYSGTYFIDKEAVIEIGELASTEMFCEDDQISQTYYEALRSVDSYHVASNQLSLLSEGKPVIVYLQSGE